MLRPNEVSAIAHARANGEYWRAALLERQAKGRWIENQVRNDPQIQALGLTWNRTGVDVRDPNNPRIGYDILSGTDWNMNLHAQRMADVLFRFITFK